MSSADGPPDPNPWAPPSAGQHPPPGGPPAPPYQAPPYQYASQPGPAYWPVYPPAAKPRRGWILWVVLAGVLVVGGCGAMVATVGVRAYHEIDDAQSVANQYLWAVERGDADRAQSLLCDEESPDVVQQAFAAGIRAHRVVGVAMQHNFGRRYARKTANVTVELTLSAGTQQRDVIAVSFEHGAWLVCGGIRFAPPR